MRPRIMVIGIGAVSSAAQDSPGFVDALREGRQCFAALDDPRAQSLNATHAGIIAGLELGQEDPIELRALDRNFHLALKAFRQALSNAKLLSRPLGPRAAVVFGTCSGGMLSIERHYEGLARGVDIIDESLLFSKRYYTTAKILAWAAGASGPALSIVTACSAGAGAIAQGADLIRSGLVDIAIAGGSDTLALSTLAGFDALKATCKGVCSPFSKNIGLNLGEGAAFVVLVRESFAAEHGAEPLAELLGYGLSNDAYHPTAPDPSTKGQVVAMQRALDDGGHAPEDLDYINAHGTGTRANDLTESKAIARLLGERVAEVPVSSTKSMIGHCLGAAGALEASATLLAARDGFIPPTAGYQGAREGCMLTDLAPDSSRPWRGRTALSNSFGFGGHNASLLLDVFPSVSSVRVGDESPSRNRAAITGLGVVSPVGWSLEHLADDSMSGIVEVERFATPVAPFEAGLVPPIDIRKVDRRLDLKGMDLFSQYAAVAARLALENAGLKPRPQEMFDVGLVMGIATGPSRGEEDHLRAVFESGFEIESLGAFPYVVPNEAAGNAARALMLKGHSTVIAAGRGAGLFSLISSAIALEQGHAKTIIASSADELTERTLTDGYRLGFWGPRTRVAPGEGGAAFLMESSGWAESRGVKKIAEIDGFAMATDIANPFRADGSSLVSALNGALEKADVGADRIQTATACLSGTSTDELTLKAIEKVFENREIPIVELSQRIGLCEATLPLFEISYALAKAEPGDRIAACSLSPEGFAAAVVLRVGY